MSNSDNIIHMELENGLVVIEMLPEVAPNHVIRIKELIRNSFYDGLIFHRVINDFMAQTGCPEGSGFSGSGQKLKAEFNDTPYTRGTVGMARSMNPDSGDSQFFITFGDCAFLNGEYTVWGQVIEGMEHIDEVEKGEPPANPSKISKMRILSDTEALNVEAV